MDIFLSWSGASSKEVALFFKGYLPAILPNVKPWLSETDIQAGEKWANEIEKKLKKCNFGIIFITESNKNEPWLLFEAGALSKQGDVTRVCPYLIGVTTLQNGPLSHFEWRKADHDGTWKLIADINKNLGQNALDETKILSRSFELLFWHELKPLLENLPQPQEQARWGISNLFDGQNKLDQDILLREWDAIYNNKFNQLDALGHSLSFVSKRRESLIASIRNHGKVRLVLMNPYLGYHKQLIETANLVRWQHGDFQQLDDITRIGKMTNKVLDTIKFVFSVKEALQPEGKESALEIRLATNTIYHNITRSDNRMIVTHYLSSTHEQGQNGPTLVLHKSNDGFLFDRHKSEFDRIWNSSIPIEASKSRSNSISAIAKYLDSAVQAYSSVFEKKVSKIPLPSCAIIFPTYRCTDKNGNRPCSYCTYSKMPMSEMEVSKFKSITEYLCLAEDGPRIKALELSGGGEPTQHERFRDLLAILSNIKTKRAEDNLELGLLTNGLFMPELENDMGMFSYIRVNLPENMYSFFDNQGTNGYFKSYIQTISNLTAKLANTRIGIKLVVSKNNLNKIANIVKYLHDNAHVHHIKIKPICKGPLRPDMATLEKISDDICILKTNGDGYHDVIIDLYQDQIPSTHKCWISPLFTVIDPESNIYKCCNFGSYPPQTPVTLGEFPHQDPSTFMNLWRSEKHLSMLMDVDVDNICHMCNAAECRFFEYQTIAEAFLYPFLHQGIQRRVKML